MRIVHISTGDIDGGAARAAFRLHAGLLRLGLESHMLVRKKGSDSETVSAVPCRNAAIWEVLQTNYIDQNRTPGWNTYFSLGQPGVDLAGHPAVQNADVIHLHWVAGFQSVLSLASLAGLAKPIVWTLHDQRPLTGGCHFSNGCRKFETDCSGCPQLADDPCGMIAANLSDQAQVAANRRIQVVAPSHWLADCARASKVFRHCPVEVIPYGLGTGVFAPVDPIEARRRLGITDVGVTLLFGADHGAERRKGFAELLQALRICREDARFQRGLDEGQVHILCFGRPNEELAAAEIPVHSLGYLRSEEHMAAAYSAADVYLLPSLEDNLPNTMLESLSCGTPVIAFKVGGVPDVIRDGQTGRLLPVRDAGPFARAILECVLDPGRLREMRRHSRETIESGYTLECQGRRYVDLYRRLRSAPGIALSPASKPSAEFGRIFPRVVDASLKRVRRHLKRNTHLPSEQRDRERLLVWNLQYRLGRSRKKSFSELAADLESAGSQSEVIGGGFRARIRNWFAVRLAEPKERKET